MLLSLQSPMRESSAFALIAFAQITRQIGYGKRTHQPHMRLEGLISGRFSSTTFRFLIVSIEVEASRLCRYR